MLHQILCDLIFQEDNEFNGTLPTAWVNLTNLQTLNLDNNKLTGRIPQSYWELPNLTEVSPARRKWEKSHQREP